VPARTQQFDRKSFSRPHFEYVLKIDFFLLSPLTPTSSSFHRTVIFETFVRSYFENWGSILDLLLLVFKL
jgi:hypothetical protein